jgi:hypothetical protein
MEEKESKDRGQETKEREREVPDDKIREETKGPNEFSKEREIKNKDRNPILIIEGEESDVPNVVLAFHPFLSLSTFFLHKSPPFSISVSPLIINLGKLLYQKDLKKSLLIEKGKHDLHV